MAECPHGSSMPDELIQGLEDSQAGTGRHKCPVCAYEKGTTHIVFGAGMESCGHGGLAPVHVLEDLPAYQGTPARHKCVTCAFTEGVARGAAIPDQDTITIVDESEQQSQGSLEGAPNWRTHRVYERDPRNRAKAIMYHGTTCFGCGFSFDSVYTPEHAEGYIEVHHIYPLSEGPKEIDPHRDLIPLCANCHRMVHRRGKDWLDLEELRRLLAKAKDSTGRA